jgi:hypothetical protein
MFEPWTTAPSAGSRSVRFLDRDGDLVGEIYLPQYHSVAPEYARRIVACVNALRTMSTESIERMNPDDWPRVIAESWAALRVSESSSWR